jgi:hypothetical protein
MQGTEICFELRELFGRAVACVVKPQHQLADSQEVSDSKAERHFAKQEVDDQRVLFFASRYKGSNRIDVC